MSIPDLKIIRREAVLNRSGMSKTWLNDRVNDGLMPPSIALGGRAVGWLKHEVDAVLAAMAINSSEEAIKELVNNLVSQREYIAVQLQTFDCA